MKAILAAGAFGVVIGIGATVAFLVYNPVLYPSDETLEHMPLSAEFVDHDPSNGTVTLQVENRLNVAGPLSWVDEERTKGEGGTSMDESMAQNASLWKAVYDEEQVLPTHHVWPADEGPPARTVWIPPLGEETITLQFASDACIETVSYHPKATWPQIPPTVEPLIVENPSC